MSVNGQGNRIYSGLPTKPNPEVKPAFGMAAGEYYRQLHNNCDVRHGGTAAPAVNNLSHRAAKVTLG